MGELSTAFDLLKALNECRAVEGLTLSGGLGEAAAFLGGRLNMRCVSLAGHSYGGATVAALTAADAALLRGASRWTPGGARSVGHGTVSKLPCSGS